MLEVGLKNELKKPQGSKLFFIMLILVLFLSQSLSVGKVRAQNEAGISILPAEANLFFNGSNSIVLEVWLTDVVDINTFDITFHYDPTKVKLDGWAHGGILSPLFQNKVLNDPINGILQLAFAKFGLPAYSGSGVLLRLTFSGLTAGTSAIIMNPAKIWSEGSLVPLIVSDGTFNATFDPNIVEPVSVLGSVDLQGRNNRSGGVLELGVGQYVGQGPYSKTSTNSSGNNVSFTDVAMDAYTVVTNTPCYLNIPASMNKQIMLMGTGKTLMPLALVGGNAVWTDNEINVFDLSLVSGELGKAVFVDDADLNGDGKVDIFDLALVAGNFGLKSEDVYAAWNP